MEVPKIYPRSSEINFKAIRSFDWEGDVLHTTDTLRVKFGEVTDREVLSHYETDFTELREFLEAKRAGKKLRPVVRARWKHRKDSTWSGGGCTECSACGFGYSDEYYHEVEEFNFCPNCSADMREEGE